MTGTTLAVIGSAGIPFQKGAVRIMKTVGMRAPGESDDNQILLRFCQKSDGSIPDSQV